MMSFLRRGIRAATRLIQSRFSQPWEPTFSESAGAVLTRMLRLDSDELVPVHAVRTVRPLANKTIR